MLNVAVLVSGGGTNLQALLDAEHDGKLGEAHIALVVSSKPGVYALERAAAAKVPSKVIARKSFETQDAWDDALLSAMEGYDIGLIVLAGFLTVIGKKVIDRYENRILNVHPALIPSFCGKGFYGLRVHEEVLARGVKLTGATVHIVNCECDGGPILLQKGVAVHADDTPETLQRRVMEEAEWKLLPEAVSLFSRDAVEVVDGRAFVKEHN